MFTIDKSRLGFTALSWVYLWLASASQFFLSLLIRQNVLRVLNQSKSIYHLGSEKVQLKLYRWKHNELDSVKLAGRVEM